MLTGQLRPLCVGAGDLLGKDACAACRLQFVVLIPQVLVIGRYPGVADKHPAAFLIDQGGGTLVSHGVPITLHRAPYIIRDLRLISATHERQEKWAGEIALKNLGLMQHRRP